MRVYEFAKERGLAAKDVVGILQEAGFSIASHMSVLSPEALDFLQKKFDKAHAAATLTPVVKEEIKVTSPVVERPKVHEKNVAASSLASKQTTENQPVLRRVAEARAVGPKEKIAPPAPEIVTEIELVPMTLADFADKIQKPVTDVILTLLKWKILSNKNQLLSVDLVRRIAQHYQINVVQPVSERSEEKVMQKVASAHGSERLPIVVVMGHVDHGKTTLLDYIRKTRVAAREKGGITQHLGAYEAQTSQGNLVFLDTPGHEAFSKIRVRGTHIADIAVLVVAADDGIMPQTVEAIKHARAMQVPIIVAINKIDRVDSSRAEVIKRELAQQYDLMPEEWGGSVIYVPISAKFGTNVDKLLEMIVLQAQLMELKADANASAKGYVLEAKLEKGFGATATFIAQQGTLHVGDFFTCGNTNGKVSALVDSSGKRIPEVGPSVPVQIAGFDQLPEAGDCLEVVSKEAYLAAKNLSLQKTSSVFKARSTQATGTQLIVKADNDSSRQALLESIEKISKKVEKGYIILQAGIGPVSESDVVLASDTGARIVTLHVKAEPNAMALAQRLGVSIATFDIIYKLLESLQEYAESIKTVKMVRRKTGEAFVRKVFDIKDLGVIAGSYVKEGIFTRDGSVVIWRGKQKVGEGKISSLQRDRKPVKEIHAGFECAFMVDGFTEWEVDDRVECFTEQPESSKK